MNKESALYLAAAMIAAGYRAAETGSNRELKPNELAGRVKDDMWAMGLMLDKHFFQVDKGNDE